MTYMLLLNCALKLVEEINNLTCFLSLYVLAVLRLPLSDCIGPTLTQGTITH